MTSAGVGRSPDGDGRTLAGARKFTNHYWPLSVVVVVVIVVVFCLHSRIVTSSKGLPTYSPTSPLTIPDEQKILSPGARFPFLSLS